MAEISKGMDERDVQLTWKRKIRFSVDPRWPLVSQRRFFPRRGPSEILASLTVATTKKQRRLNFPRNPFNSPRRGELIGTPEPGININDLVVT